MNLEEYWLRWLAVSLLLLLLSKYLGYVTYRWASHLFGSWLCLALSVITGVFAATGYLFQVIRHIEHL